MTSVGSFISALKQHSQTVCNRLTESLDYDRYESLLDDLKVRITELEAAARDEERSLPASESGEVQSALIVARGWQVKLLERMHFITLARQVTPVVKKRAAKLPEIKLVTSKGEYDEWETFWSSFRNKVDFRDDLEPSVKPTYLLQCLEGEPKEMIKGLLHADSNYVITVNLLTDRYEDKIKQTDVLLQKFYNLPSPKHNVKDLHSFLTECRKVREQMQNLTTVDDSLVVRSTIVRKLSLPTYEVICDYHKRYDFSLEQMDDALQYMIGKLEQASLALVSQTNVKSVEDESSHPKQKGGQFSCSYCSGDHRSVDCTKYKTINARKDHIIAQRLCFNCLRVGHSTKSCKTNRTCHICHQHHHTSLCHQHSNNNTNNSSSKGSDATSNTKGQTSQTRSSSHTQTLSHPYPPQQQQQQKPVVTQGKNNASKNPSSSSQSTSITNVNLAQISSLTSNVLPTATLDLHYFNQRLNTTAFFDTGPQ